MKFNEYRNLDLARVCHEVDLFWKKNKIFKKSIEERRGEKRFVFYEGPPSANGLPGIHHVMARLIKDVFCRYKTLSGFCVERRAGWDTHGLPVELGVEKELGINKDDVGKTISVAEYNEACKSAVMKYTQSWNLLTEKMGYWVDVDSPYITYENKYIESVWFLIQRLYKKNLIYKGYTIQPYSPAAGTGLSSHELNQPGCYRLVKDLSVCALFKVVCSDSIIKTDVPVFLMAWTTTPWTLFANTGLAVGLSVQYSIVETINPYSLEKIVVVCAEKRLPEIFNPKLEGVPLDGFEKSKIKPGHTPYLIIGFCAGKDLLNIKYEQLLKHVQPLENLDDAFRVVPGDFVNTSDGTGIVHLAPTFGADDFNLAKKVRLPLMMVVRDKKMVPIVDLNGRFVEELGEFGGRFVKSGFEDPPSGNSVDVDIVVKLKKEGLAFSSEKHEHSYPHCWRTDKPILYYPLDSWFIQSTRCREELIKKNKDVNWVPKSTGVGRFNNWLENINDWNLSRSRFWGIPLPIWVSHETGAVVCVGSVEELKRLCSDSVKAGHMKKNPFLDFVPGVMSKDNYGFFDLHKNFVDEIVLVGPSGEALHREKEVVDVWFDSGAMPYAQWHYPFENKDLIDGGEFFPADFIAEGVDQTRGWFFTLHAIAVMCFDSIAFKNVISNGLVLDNNGQKMSKRLGNAVDPFRVIESHGADCVRWYMASNSQPWENLKFSVTGVVEVKQKFFSTLYNTYSFFSLYANIDSFCFKEGAVPVEERPLIDRWIISELNSLVFQVDSFYKNYDPTPAARSIQSFVVDKLSNWYVRLVRRRFWKGEYDLLKISAYQTLYECLVCVSKLSSPIAPFFMERLFCDLNSVTKKEPHLSVHLSFFPKHSPQLIDSVLEKKMSVVKTICSLSLALRKKSGLRVRQPLSLITVCLDPGEEGVDEFASLISSEVNVKRVVFSDEAGGFFKRQLVVNFPVLGKKFGSLVSEITKVVVGFDEKSVSKYVDCGQIMIEVNGEKISLSGDDLLVKNKEAPGLLTAKKDSVFVVLNTDLSVDLLEEGFVREVVNVIQNTRKDLSLAVTDHVSVSVFGDKKGAGALKKHIDYVSSEVLAKNISINLSDSKTGSLVDFNNYKLYIVVQTS